MKLQVPACGWHFLPGSLGTKLVDGFSVSIYFRTRMVSFMLPSTRRNAEVPVLCFHLPWAAFLKVWLESFLSRYTASYVQVLERNTMSTLLPAFPSPQKATWDLQTSTDKRNHVICQGELLGVGTGVQSVNDCSGDVKSSESLSRYPWYLR